MANSIQLATAYVPILDKIYKEASLTSILDGAAELARYGANANELIVPVMNMDGLANYDRNSGYVGGDVTLTNKTYACNFDRGRSFQVDYLDDAESANIAFGKLADEFIRTKVVPELDAFRFATYAGLDGISTTDAATLSTGEDVIAALRAGTETMDEDEVPVDERVLFITPTLYGLIEDLDTTKSRAVLARFASIVFVPQARFYTAITQYDGTTAGQTAGGFIKNATDGRDINFMIIHKPAVIQYQKHVAPKIVDPNTNQNADAWKFGYRTVGIADAYYSKLAGIYLNKAES